MEIEVAIEITLGGSKRWAMDSAGQWRVVHEFADWACPFNYGYVLDTHNPADGEAMDALVLATRRLMPGSTVATRVIGVLRRDDGDHKLLCVDIDDETYGLLTALDEAPPEELRKAERWLLEEQDKRGSWEDAQAAEEIIDRSAAPEPTDCHAEQSEASGRSVRGDRLIRLI